jgi:hypothetical protein
MRVDLATELLRETYRNPKKSLLYQIQERSFTKLRAAIVNAKRFVLDDSMAEFLAELSTTPFNRVDNARMPDALESLRHSAIPPFDFMFIQLDNRAFRRGLLRVQTKWPKADAWRNQLIEPDSDEIAKEIGWLVETKHGTNEVMVTEVFQVEGTLIMLPYRWVYRTVDLGFPETVGYGPGDNICTRAGMFAHGIQGFRDHAIGVWYVKPLTDYPENQLVPVTVAGGESFKVHSTVIEYGSTIRYLFAFLATLNNVPKIATEMSSGRHFIAEGLRRRHLDHTVLTLNLPAGQSTERLAMRLIAQARRGWHLVRPHWRLSHPRLNGRYCASRAMHLWTERDETGHAYCKQCDAKRVWIELPHGRGDPSIATKVHESVNVRHRKRMK